MFSIISRTNFVIWVTFNTLSANALNLDGSKILSLGKELNNFVKVMPLLKLRIFTEDHATTAESHNCMTCPFLFISVYLLLLQVTHSSDAPGRWLVVTGDSA